MNVFGTTHAGFIIFFVILCFIAILLIALLLAKKISNKILLIEIFVIAFLCVKLGCSAALDMVFNNSSNIFLLVNHAMCCISNVILIAI